MTISKIIFEKNVPLLAIMALNVNCAGINCSKCPLNNTKCDTLNGKLKEVLIKYAEHRDSHKLVEELLNIDI